MTEANIPDSLPEWIKSHLRQYHADPDKGHLWDSSTVGGDRVLPCLILTTTGRRSGRSLPMPLIYGRSDDAYVVIASKAGAPAHPAWYLNLSAAPDVQVQVAHEHFAARARTAQGGERERLWALMVDIYPPYVDYQAKTERQIPVVVLERS